jgi:hypothetical protein
MTSAARIAANRANARHSTGPRTARGKTASSHNACKHGFRSASAPHTNPEFEALLDAFRAEHHPTTLAEESCVRTIATAVCKIHEIDRLDYEAFNTCPIPVYIARLHTLSRYRVSAENALHKALNLLLTLKPQRPPLASFVQKERQTTNEQRRTHFTMFTDAPPLPVHRHHRHRRPSLISGNLPPPQ